MPAPSTTHTVNSSDGTQIGVHTVGLGPPLVFVHGAWNWADHWLGVAEELTDAHTCSVMDRRARGKSGDGEDYSFNQEIDDVIAVLEDAGSDSSLLGHSSGAIYALEAARRVPVERLVLYEPPLRWAEQGDPADLVDRIRALVDKGDTEQAAELFFREEGRQSDEGIAMLKSTPTWEPMLALAAICVREWQAILDADLSIDRYRDVSTPTLLLAGSENLDHPSMATEPLSRVLPDAHTEVLEGHGHTAHLAAPTLVANTVQSFLAAPVR